MIFLTVGTQFPFDRLVKSVDDVISRNGLEEEIFAQIGESLYRPRNFKYVSSLNKQTCDELMRKASGIISHVGMGTITTALNYSKPLLGMPRLKRYGEVVNNHQVAIARKFEELGHILVAYREEGLPSKIERLKTFVPRPRKNQAKVVADRIARFLEVLSEKTDI